MLEPSQILPEAQVKSYGEWNAVLQDERAKLLKRQEESAGFESRLTERLQARELHPEARRLEKEALTQLFTAPGEVRSELSAAGVRPSEISAIQAGRMNTYMDRIDSIRQSRKDREDSISDLIKSTVEGIKSETARLKGQVDFLEDQRNFAFKEYQEKQRQAEKALTNKLLNNLENDQKIANNEAYHNFQDLRNKTEENQKELYGADYMQHWDGGLDPDDYIQQLKQHERNDPTNGREHFISTFPPSKYINFEKDYNVKHLRDNGITDIELLGNASPRELKMLIIEDMKQATTEAEFENIKANAYGVNISPEDMEDEFRFYLNQKFGAMGDVIYQRLFPVFTGSGVTGGTNPTTGEKIE